MNEEKVEKTEEKANQKDKLLKKLKQFSKTRWFPLIVAVAVIVLAVGVVLVMLLFGWRITYAPELENNWDAVSGVASWFSVFASFITAWAAIQIPKKIAEQQNKISLLNTRFEISDAIRRLSVNISMTYFMSQKSHFDFYTLSDDELIKILSFASTDEYKKVRAIINRYNLYFPKFQEHVDRLLNIYLEITMMYLKLYQNKDTKIFELNEIVDEILELLDKANKFIDSAQFGQLTTYMKDVLSLSK